MVLGKPQTLNQTPRSSFQVLRDVTFGLLIRELKTRFGSYRLGYAWAAPRKDRREIVSVHGCFSHLTS